MSKSSATLKGPIHFIGIGGSGMAPLAELCLARNLVVSGSDLVSNSQAKRLKELGVKVFLGHDPIHLGEAQTVVFSSAVRDANVELTAARQKQLNILHRSDLLNQLIKEKYAITIAGTHGKTTTSAMITHMLQELGLGPTAAIGGTMLKHGSAACIGNGKYFVAEVDESDGSLTKYAPDVAVLTNIESDHLDYFDDLTKLQDLFRSYIQKIPEPDGVYVIGWDNVHCRDLAQTLDLPKIAYGFSLGCDVRALEYSVKGNILRFSAMVVKERVEVSIPKIFGKHNVQNALAALATAHALELDLQAAANCFKNFFGVERRANILWNSPSLKVIDDYAHNPGKIVATVKAVKEAWPEDALYVIFEPHRYSRLKTMYGEITSAFKGAERVYVVPVYSAGEDVPPEEISLNKIAKDIADSSTTNAVAFPNPAQNLANILENSSRPGIILSIGAGDSSKISYALRDFLNATEVPK